MKIWEISRNPNSRDERFWNILTSNVHYSREIPERFLVSADSKDRARVIGRERFNLNMQRFEGNSFTLTTEESNLTQSRIYFNCRLLKDDQDIDEERILS